MASTIVDLAEARANRRKNTDSHAPSEPRFIVQHGSKPGTRRVVSYATGKPVNETVYTDADGNAPFDLRDRLNAEAEIDDRLARLPRLDKLVVFFGSAETQQRMADMLTAYAEGAFFWFAELVDEFDRDYTEATAGL